MRKRGHIMIDKKSTDINAAERSSERLRLFQTIIYGADRESVSPLRRLRTLSRNLHVARYAALLIIITSVFWLLYDFLSGGALRYTTGMALAATLLLVAFSVYMLSLSLLSVRISDNLIRYSFLAYYICIIIFVTVLAVTSNTVMSDAHISTPQTGIPISTFFMFIIVLAPLPSAADSAIIGVFGFAMIFVPSFAPGHNVYDLKQNIILFGCLVFAYLYVRRVNTALSDSMQKLSAQSYTDPLTGVLNRRSIEVYLNDIYKERRAQSVAVLLFDIDDFKRYNDNFSHSEGDLVLKRVCGTIIDAIKNRSCFLFRYGGEEFVILLLDQTDDEIISAADEIREALHNANIERTDMEAYDRVTVTIGCSREDIGESLPGEFIVRADEQLYIGKNSGKNCVVYKGQIYRHPHKEQ